MVHVIFLAEGYSDFFEAFQKEFHGKIYANGKAKLRMREMKPYTCSINEVGLDEFLSDIKSFCALNMGMNKGAGKNKKYKGTTDAAKQRFYFFAKMLRKLFPQIKDIKGEIENAKDNNLRNKLAKQGKHFLIALYPIGKILDKRYPDGKEIV